MVIELSGRNRDVKILTASWSAIWEIARVFGWTPEYNSPPKMPRWSWAAPWLLTDDSALALARALYNAIRAIENDDLRKPLVELIKSVGVGPLRDFADFAVEGGLGCEGTFDWDDFA
jgi:hypothetical protein